VTKVVVIAFRYCSVELAYLDKKYDGRSSEEEKIKSLQKARKSK
jgi:hypothetical protein